MAGQPHLILDHLLWVQQYPECVTENINSVPLAHRLMRTCHYREIILMYFLFIQVDHSLNRPYLSWGHRHLFSRWRCISSSLQNESSCVSLHTVASWHGSLNLISHFLFQRSSLLFSSLILTFSGFSTGNYLPYCRVSTALSFLMGSNCRFRV